MAKDKPFDMHFKAAGEDAVIHFLFDLDLMSNRIIFNALAANTFYEAELSTLLFRLLRPGDTFIDVGAHIGYFSLLASKLVGNDGRVIAIEPDDINAERLEKHKEMNDCANIEIFRTVLSDTPGPKNFYVNADNDGGHSLWDVGAHPFNKKSAANPETRTIDGETLDSIIKKAGSPTVKLVKMDTEGAEPGIIRGAPLALGAHEIPFVVSEVNEFGLRQMGDSQTVLRDLMKANGYDTFLLNPEGCFPTMIPHTVPIASAESLVFNVLFSDADSLAPWWGVEMIA